MGSIPTFNALRDAIHAENVERGWWAQGVQARNRGEILALVHSEISEAYEGLTCGLMDDHLPHRQMFEVELADATIRILDVAGADGFDLDAVVPLIFTPLHAGWRDLLLNIHADISRALEGYRKSSMHKDLNIFRTAEVELTRALLRIWFAAAIFDYDLPGAIEEKRAYNGRRADHQLEARQRVGGKAF